MRPGRPRTVERSRPKRGTGPVPGTGHVRSGHVRGQTPARFLRAQECGVARLVAQDVDVRDLALGIHVGLEVNHAVRGGCADRRGRYE